MNQMTPEELEKFIHRQLRDLPARTAPQSLEARVMAAVRQRALVPWYHKSWQYWPKAFRMGFLLLATAAAGAVIAAFHLGDAGINKSAFVTEASQRLGILSKIYRVAVWMGDIGSQVFASIPPVWLYGGLGVVALCYASFFGLGAAAYRTLYRNH